jgi:hypothetical protein
MPHARYRHLFLPGPTFEKEFGSPSQGVSKRRFPIRDRAAHAARIQQQLKVAFEEDERRRVALHAERHGLYLTFFSEPGFDLVLKSLESRKKGILLLNVRTEQKDHTATTFATVYLPRAAAPYFLRKVREYADEDNRSQNLTTDGVTLTPKNAQLISSIAEVHQALLETSFWMDRADLLPAENPDWVEVWLSSEDLSVIERFQQLCEQVQIRLGEGRLTFPERTVLLICANRAQLVQLVERSDNIAEFRAAREVGSFFIEQENRDQSAWVDDLLQRVKQTADDQVVVLVLDHGVNNGHRLLKPLLPDADRHSVIPEWGTDDDDGHGTLMAGTAGYGDLLHLVLSKGPVVISHGLESAKILPPPPGQNPKRLWGHFTAQGISLAEIQAPHRKRVICMAVASPETRDRGRPSSWSGKIDEMASGYDDDKRRLIILCAGNIDEPNEWLAYPDSNKTSEVHDPGQAWNALTVGAFTSKTRLADTDMKGYVAIAAAGDLSPFSSTSLTWPPRKWPIKPEVLFEGGNVAKGPGNSVFDHDDLKLISTYRHPHEAQFAAFSATSAASAQAAWMAARIQAAYPAAWPETVRALIVHSAEWTDAQKRSFLTDERKLSYARLARVCGYGVPDLERALYCAANSLTLITQSTIQPFDKHPTESRYISREMHFYRLPWPRDVLQDLGETPVRMRVTLSYFVEPSPSEVGWQDRYRYASHALRFELNGPGESESEFLQRINAKAREDDKHPGTAGPGDRWTLGDARNVGSIHSDIWTGNAVELAASNLIAVYPAVGWWRERHHLGRWNRQTRYSLLLSIQMPGQEIDIYTPVAAQVGIPIPVPIATPAA